MKTNSTKDLFVYEALFSINFIMSILTMETPSKNNKHVIILFAFISPGSILPSPSITCFTFSMALSYEN